MDVDVTVLAGLKFVPVHEEFPVELLVQFVEDQASLGGHQSAVGIGVALIADVTDGLALGVDLIHHVDKVLLVVPVIAVALGHSGIDLVQGSLHNVVHLRNRDAVFASLLRFLLGIFTDKGNLIFCKTVHNTARGFIDCGNDLVHIKFFLGAVLLDNVHMQSPSIILYVVYFQCVSH